MECISCPLAGWAVRVGEGQSLILKTSIRKSWGGKGGKALRSWFSCSWILSNHKNPELEWDSNSSPFEILRRVALWRAQYDESCKLCSGGSYCLSLASMVESYSRGPERRWFTLWRMSAVRVRLSPTRELSRYKAI